MSPRQETVTVKIKKDGSGMLSVDLDGFVGGSCDDLKAVEAQLGMVTHTEDTDEARLYENPAPAFNELADL